MYFHFTIHVPGAKTVVPSFCAITACMGRQPEFPTVYDLVTRVAHSTESQNLCVLIMYRSSEANRAAITSVIISLKA